MAFCKNEILILGYFTHVTTLGEVKEQVLKYIPVMARPMVMYRDKHPIIWTGVYADIEVRILKKYLVFFCQFDEFWQCQKVPDHRESEKKLWMIKLEKMMKHKEIWDCRNWNPPCEDDVSTKEKKPDFNKLAWF